MSISRPRPTTPSQPEPPPYVSDVPVYFSGQKTVDPYSKGHLSRSHESGELARIGYGLYVPRPAWNELKPWERHTVKAHATASRSRQELVLSHESAALMYGLSFLGKPPSKVQVTSERGTGGHRLGALDRHTTTSWVEPVQVGDVWCTPPAQTVVDLAATHSFESALIVADSALRLGIVTPEELQVEMERVRYRRGIGRIRAVIERADGASGSASESLSRARMYQLGARIPLLQKRFFIGGSTYYVDFYWEEEDAVGEYDGLSKYRTPDGAGNSEALIAEKVREDSIRGQVRLFRRWGWNDALTVTGLERALRDLGVLAGHSEALFGLRR